MIRNETFSTTGEQIRVETVDVDTGLVTLIVQGETVSTRPITANDLAPFLPQPLDPTGALATLLAVTEVLTVDDAANAVGLIADDLVAEAQAWAMGDLEP